MTPSRRQGNKLPPATKGWITSTDRKLHFNGTSFTNTRDYQWYFYTDGSCTLYAYPRYGNDCLYTREYGPGVIKSSDLKLRYDRIMLPDLREDENE